MNTKYQLLYCPTLGGFLLMPVIVRDIKHRGVKVDDDEQLVDTYSRPDPSVDCELESLLLLLKSFREYLCT